MRIAKLDLLAYGPFRGLELDFSAPGVHVVYGRNEAGKSTTLRAITGLLYGIDVRTKDAHVHKPGELRIGGTLVASDGSSVRVVRRKGAANTLLDDAGQAIDDAVLLRLLHGVSEETFKTAFGLDLFSLQRGAASLLEGKGDIGGSLFDASAGGGEGAARILAELVAEADRLYKPRASTSELAVALKAYEQAAKEARDKQSLPEAYTKQDESLAQANAEKNEKAALRSELALRKAQLERLENRLPRDRRKRELVATLEGLGAVSKHGPRIMTLQTRLGAYESAERDRRALRAEADLLRGQVTEAARRAGVVLGTTDGTPSVPTIVDERTAKRIQSLVSDATRLAGALDGARLQIERDERELGRLRSPSSAASDAAIGDAALAALQGALDRGRALGDAKARVAAEIAKVRKRKAEVDARVVALRAFVRPAEELVTLKLPLGESIERLAERAADLERVVERLVERDREAETKEVALERQIAASSGDFAPPDKSALDAARAVRDAALGPLRDARAAATRGPSIEPATLVALEADFERALRAADAVADRMIADADRVTALARFRAEHANYGKERAQWRVEREAATAKLGALEAEHAKLWADAGIAPLGFSEMLAWLERHAQVVEAFERLAEAEIDAKAIEASVGAARDELAAAMTSASITVSPTATLGDLIEVASARVERIESARHAAAETVRTIEKFERQLDDRRASASRDEAALAESREKLLALVAPLGLPADATGDEVLHALDARKDLFALEEKRAGLASRAAVADADARSFEEDAAKCAADLAPDLVGLSAREIVSSLVARSKAAHAAEQELASVEKELAELGEARVPEDLLAIASDAPAVARALEETEARHAEVDDELTRLVQNIAGIEAGMRSMRTDSGAAQASAAAQEALARVRSVAERYARAKVAGVVLAREIERYREENQGPLLTIASSLFARLTLGGYTGVRAGFDEKDRPSLCAVRAGSVDVEIAGLSEGTRDQLYLSLRLASLLRHAETAEPMPIVLDDVFVQFDDDRSRAALAVAAEVSEKLQVLFFTHHARHVELAREAIPAGRLTVHELGAGTSAAATSGAASSGAGAA